MKIFLLPGLYNSGPGHWQSLWETSLPDVERVQQTNWEQPDRDLWVQTLSAAINACDDDIVLVAHSLGCALTAWWVAQDFPGVRDKSKVKAALLVAPPGVNRENFPAPSFAPMPTTSFPFPVKVVASEDDPWCEIEVAENWARLWRATFHNIGAYGHINGDSGLGVWKQGQDYLSSLLSEIRAGRKN
ncbi:alpha/beta hydrolase [Undibacterium sp. 14-3-2]|uniref:RBBP9/YdeN family alpha/beta hydrolase n=1 Tax=Undibacterium sp. 14-3-2 TaxID=2800129 RepID=UPI0019063142|nr:alpha/beta hydrolase [Undibacterium sp. 14-3-2]MBK1888497.1 alpha/beta hydrolase [Undibacterium sp. 14-3-2]